MHVIRTIRTRAVLPALLAAGALVTALAAGDTAGAGGGCHDADAGAVDGTGGEAVVEMRELCFTPTVLKVGTGQEVTFVNADRSSHIVTGAGARWGSENLVEGELFTVAFDEPGTYPYTCMYHIGMSGAIVARDADAPGADAESGGDSPAAMSLAGGAALGVLATGGIAAVVWRRGRGV